jgi:hypothetical protein
MEKILITGTGRCGTTFLIKLFSFLGYNTGYNRDNYKQYIDSNCNSGMEKKYNENYYIIKNPQFIANNAITQILYYKHIMSNYIYFMTKYDINTIFIDFDKMINDKKYLFDKIKTILDEKNIEFGLFCNVYDEVSLISKP